MNTVGRSREGCLRVLPVSECKNGSEKIRTRGSRSQDHIRKEVRRNMAQIVTAKSAGFCFGVKRAVDMVYEEIEKGGPLYTYGPLIHNEEFVAELEEKDYFIGTELKGHVYQKYLPGQFFTLNGKYYEMISTTADNRILVRRASEHINGRISYRQIRKYIFNKMRNSNDMEAVS